MQSWVAFGVGAGLIAVGSLFMRWHVKEWQREQVDPALDEYDKNHYRARYRRRMQTSGMIVALGILIPLWDWLWERQFVIAGTIVAFLVFGLLAWVILMALGDMYSTRSHSQVAMSKVRQKQRELERKVAELRGQAGDGPSSEKPNGYH